MTTRFTQGNILRMAADAADAADAAEKARSANRTHHVIQVQRILGAQTMFTEQMVACWLTVADWTDVDDVEHAIGRAEARAAADAGPDDEEFDNVRAAAWLVVAATLRERFQ